MEFYATWPYFTALIVLLVFAGGPLLKWADTPPTETVTRLATIDGLRGFLALSVFFHHGAIFHHYLLTHRWELPPSRFYANLGQAGVAMFFMITSYLFWSQMIRKKGRPNFLRLFIGRIFRIVPLYLVLSAFVLVAVGCLSGWKITQRPAALLAEVGSWMAGGVVIGGDVNGQSTQLLSAGVTWSLRYEWMFYASLLILSLFARRRAVALAAPAVAFCAAAAFLALHPHKQRLACILMFTVGMTLAAVKERWGDRLRLPPQWAVSSLVVALLAAALFGFDGMYDTAPTLLLGAAFALIVFGATVYGLLLTRPARRLGDVSYGIYLLQGPVLYLGFLAPGLRSFDMASPWAHWLCLMSASLTLVLIATLAHAAVERPGVKLGQRLWGWAAERRKERLIAEAT